MSINNLFAAGGVVMWPLLACSVLALALIVERVVFWVRVNKRQHRVVRDVLNFYRLNNMVAVLDRLKQNADLPMTRIFSAALELEQPTPEEFRLALESEAQAEIPLLKRFNNIFETMRQSSAWHPY